jgi:hypothetical protein
MSDDLVVAISGDVVESLRAKFEAVLPHLDERQQRLVMAGEARRWVMEGSLRWPARQGRRVAGSRWEWPSWKPERRRWAGPDGRAVVVRACR